MKHSEKLLLRLHYVGSLLVRFDEIPQPETVLRQVIQATQYQIDSSASDSTSTAASIPEDSDSALSLKMTFLNKLIDCLALTDPKK